jgi:hypothetical protein
MGDPPTGGFVAVIGPADGIADAGTVGEAVRQPADEHNKANNTHASIAFRMIMAALLDKFMLYIQ